MAAAGGGPSERALAYLRAYGVPARRIRKHRREESIVREAVAAAAPSGAVLDCPSGWGRLAGAVGSDVRRVVSADLDPSRLRILRHLGVGRALLRADALRLPFRDRAFDFVLSAHLNYHLASRGERLEHVRECLRVAGRSALVSYHGSLSPRRLLRALGAVFRRRPLLRVLGERDLLRASSDGGFEIARRYVLSGFSGHRYVLLRRRTST